MVSGRKLQWLGCSAKERGRPLLGQEGGRAIKHVRKGADGVVILD